MIRRGKPRRAKPHRHLLRRWSGGICPFVMTELGPGLRPAMTSMKWQQRRPYAALARLSRPVADKSSPPAPRRRAHPRLKSHTMRIRPIFQDGLLHTSRRHRHRSRFGPRRLRPCGMRFGHRQHRLFNDMQCPGVPGRRACDGLALLPHRLHPHQAPLHRQRRLHH